MEQDLIVDEQCHLSRTVTTTTPMQNLSKSLRGCLPSNYRIPETLKPREDLHIRRRTRDSVYVRAEIHAVRNSHPRPPAIRSIDYLLRT